MKENQISIDICICTFRRNHIVNTLQSLSGLKTLPSWKVEIVVADNDDAPSALEKVNAVHLPFPVRYIHAPACNISIARNACLENSSSDYLAFIDDDELANSDWIVNLVETANSEKAEAVLGSVTATYNCNTPKWIKEGDHHSTHPVWVHGNIITGYSCNLLLDRRRKDFKSMRFRIELGKTGGEDTIYLFELYNKGGKISCAPKATIQEPVPDTRASLSWLIKRRFRSGQTHALLSLIKDGNNIKTRTITFIKALTKAGICMFTALLFLWNKNKCIEWILRGTLHIGVMSKLLGYKELIQYGR